MCMTEFETRTVIQPCGHAFCRRCLTRVVTTQIQCPICRGVICKTVPPMTNMEAGEHAICLNLPRARTPESPSANARGWSS